MLILHASPDDAGGALLVLGFVLGMLVGPALFRVMSEAVRRVR